MCGRFLVLADGVCVRFLVLAGVCFRLLVLAGGAWKVPSSSWWYMC